eukprot:TRINITY_DN7560_c0_g1_i1.p1 TRINITY_DN7560_c0_g1~~TRINITY_DN7560_c0_g1_i1.p1  ORF type:complete len:350 (-),score=62.73 TRINITY_DN7560_c0_g1_i1:250-1272(-)
MTSTDEPTPPPSSSIFHSVFELWKPRLSGMVVVTTYATFVSCGGEWFSLRAGCLVFGTFCHAACANTFNQVIESERDALMPRTRFRPIPLNKISKPKAVIQGVGLGLLGTVLLYKGVNAKTCLLGLSNILIYTCCYTLLKPIHSINTWVGTLNGCLPPLMGSSALDSLFHPNALYISSVLYLWQIPHFMAISYMYKDGYAKAGYQMLSINDPPLAAFHSVLHSALLFPLCWGLFFFDNSSLFSSPSSSAPSSASLHIAFLPISSLINYWYLRDSILFQEEITHKTAKKLFFYSLGHLPALLLATCLCQQNVLKSFLSPFAQLAASFSTFSFASFRFKFGM